MFAACTWNPASERSVVVLTVGFTVLIVACTGAGCGRVPGVCFAGVPQHAARQLLVDRHLGVHFATQHSHEQQEGLQHLVQNSSEQEHFGQRGVHRSQEHCRQGHFGQEQQEQVEQVQQDGLLRQVQQAKHPALLGVMVSGVPGRPVPAGRLDWLS